MARFRQIIPDRIAAHSGANTSLAGRVYPEVAPKNASFPRATYQLVSLVDECDLSDADPGYRTARFQIDVWGDGTDSGYTDATDAAIQVRNAFRGYRGTVGGFTVQSSRIEDELDQGEFPTAGRFRGESRVTITVVLHIQVDPDTGE